MTEPPSKFDDLFSSHTVGDLDGLTSARAVPVGGLASRSLAVGFELTDRLWSLVEDHRRGVVRLPLADIERFGSDLATSVPAPPQSAPLRRLVAFEVERANGLLDASYGLIGPMPLSGRLRVAWAVGGARARLQAVARRPDPFIRAPRSWAVSRGLAAFRTLRRARHRRSAPGWVG